MRPFAVSHLIPGPKRADIRRSYSRRRLKRASRASRNMQPNVQIETSQLPDEQGRFGAFGGVFVPETLMPAIGQLREEYARAKADPQFRWQLEELLRTFCGRPTPLYFAERLTQRLGGPRIYFKREDLLHTGAHKINNAVGQGLLAVRMGKKRLIAETGAGQHGVATATVAARFGLECVVYMGETDMKRQALNVARMEFLGAKVVPVTVGQATLKEAINEAMRDWVTNVQIGRAHV